jgi:hypothetical protein
LRLGLSLTGGAAAFNPASLSPTAWYDVSDLSTLFQDSAGTTPVTADGDPVGKVLDKSGNGNHLVQATAGSRPLYKTSGGLSWLLFDGVDDSLAASFTLAQPFDRISAIRQVTWATGVLLAGTAFQAGYLYQTDFTPRLRLYSGSNGPFTDGVAVGSDAVITERHNGASSRLAANNDAYATGDAGSASAGGLMVGDGNGNPNSNMRWYGTALKSAFTDPEIAQLRTWMGAKAGLTL